MILTPAPSAAVQQAVPSMASSPALLGTARNRRDRESTAKPKLLNTLTGQRAGHLPSHQYSITFTAHQCKLTQRSINNEKTDCTLYVTIEEPPC